MKTTIDYIEEARTKLATKSDNALALKLGIARNSLSQYLSGRRVVDDYAAARIAETLDIPPLQIIAQANAEREKDEKRKAFWERVAQSAAVGLLVLAVGGPVPTEVKAESLLNQQNIYYTHKERRRRRWATP